MTNLPRLAAFLDRDGVINRDDGYVHTVDGFVLLPGVLQAARRLHEAGFNLVVVTNQAGIARGYYSEAQFKALSDWMRMIFRDAGAPLLDILYCPHHPEGTVTPYNVLCDCRKPKPGMIFRAAQRHAIDLAGSLLVGDKPSDLAAARAAGVQRCYLLDGGVYSSLNDVVDHVLSGNCPS